MTLIKLFTCKEPYIVKEGYQTIKVRVGRIDPFFEVTLGDNKVSIAKVNVEEFGPYTPAKDPKGLLKKTVKK